MRTEENKFTWIRVEDSLPKEDVRVLVCINSTRSYTDVDTDRMLDGKWVRWGADVTHWMPLPELPKSLKTPVLNEVLMDDDCDGEIVVKYYCPLVVSIERRNYWGDAENETEDMDGREAAYYIDDIKKVLDAYDDGDMAEYFDENESAAKKLVDVSWGVEAIDGILYGCITAKLNKLFTNEEEIVFKDWIEGQNSDGFGEGFEQREIKVDDGWLYVSFWHRGDNYFVCSEKEFMRRLGKKQPYCFCYKEVEKCRNYWWHGDLSEPISIAYLDFDYVSIELNLAANDEGEKSVYLLISQCSEDGLCKSNKYIHSGVQEYLSLMTSWEEVEEFMYNKLIKYCEDNNIDYTKNFVDDFFEV